MKDRLALPLLLILLSCSKPTEVVIQPTQVSEVVGDMTDLMINDVTNPPLAARFFAYTCLSGQEVLAQSGMLSSMSGKLNDYPTIQKPQIDSYSPELSALLAMIETAGKIQPSGSLLMEREARFLDSLRRIGVSTELIDNSLAFAKEISKQVLAYAKSDRYNKISNYPRYEPRNQEGTWYPTPPGFFAPVEPYIHTIRTLTLDSASQFAPPAPVEYSTNANSEFVQLLKEVHVTSTQLTVEQQEIAAFWDCNPFALLDKGHLLTAWKKISPGAHWMGITGIVAKQKNLSFSETVEVHTHTSIALMDGFIACWDEKYRSNRIRPESAIRAQLDPEWKPFLQTPPFPEYLSGHSTISTAAATVLTHYFGDSVSYLDTVEVRFGLKPREFQSFHQAANEAAISRMYGGIHFMDAITNGQTQGKQVGDWVIQVVQ